MSKPARLELTVDSRNLITELRDAAASRGATVHDCGGGHFQISGAMLVNFYPFSKKRTAYVANTKHGRHYLSPHDAVAMAFKAPPIAAALDKDRRGNHAKYKRWRKAQWKRGNRSCHWCKQPMVRDPESELAATVDHVVPLHRGGLDNPNNWVLAHARCNSARGHDMPELQKEAVAS